MSDESPSLKPSSPPSATSPHFLPHKVTKQKATSLYFRNNFMSLPIIRPTLPTTYSNRRQRRFEDLKYDTKMYNVVKKHKPSGVVIVQPVPAGKIQHIQSIEEKMVQVLIGNNGTAIKDLERQSKARLQVIPMYFPPGHKPTERLLQFDGTAAEVDFAIQLFDDLVNKTRDTTAQVPTPVHPVVAGHQPTAYGMHAPRPGYGTQPPPPPPPFGYGQPSYGAPHPAARQYRPYGQPAYGAAPARLEYVAPPPYGAPPVTQQGNSQQQPPPYNSTYGGNTLPPTYSNRN